MSLRSWLPRRLVQALEIGQQYGLTFFNGSKERTGFTSRTEAETYGQDSGVAYVVWAYTPSVDMRIEKRSDRAIARDRFVGGGVS